MPKHSLLLVITFLAALGLLAFTLTFDFGLSHRGAGGSVAVPRIQGTPLPPSMPVAGQSRLPFENAHDVLYSKINERGQLMRIFGSQLIPKPQGVTEVEWPGAEIHLTPSRILDIRSERGTFYAPDPDALPQHGQFRGRTVITLFDGPGDRSVRLDPQSPDIKLRIFIDEETRFDLELATIESTGPVHFTTPRVDFQGKGLTLSYNEKLGRITRLVVPVGQFMRLKTGSGDSTTQTAPVASKPAESPIVKPVAGAKPDEKSGDGLPQFYHVNFDHDVHVKTKDSRIKSDRLELLFGTGGKMSEDSFLKGLGFLPASQPIDGVRAVRFLAPTTDVRVLAELAVLESLFAQTGSAVPAVPPSAVAPGTPGNASVLPENVAMAPVSADDLIITWSGPFAVEPEEHPYPRLNGPDDALVHFSGNVQVDTDRQETIAANSVDYHANSELITLAGNAAVPVSIRTPKLGQLTAPGVVIDQRQGAGLLLGPGSIVAPNTEAKVVDAAQTRPDLGSGLPPGMSISWSEKVNLSFFVKGADSKPKAADSQLNKDSNIRAIKDVLFAGRVNVIHPRFDLNTDALSLSLNDPDEGRQTLSRVQADGNTHLIAKAEENKAAEKSGALDLRSDSLVLELVPKAGGQVDPHRLIATGHVHANQPDRSIEAGRLDIGLELVDQAHQPGKQTLAIRTIAAEREVKIDAMQPKSGIVADHLFVDAPAGIIDIFGSQLLDATVSREDGTLSANHIVLKQSSTAQTADVTCPGTFTFVSRPSPSATANDPTTRPGIMTISWARAMHFDQKAGTAHFEGAVQAKGDFGKNISTLYGDDELFVFVPDAQPKVLAETKPGEDSKMTMGARMIKTITATHNASFRAEGWNDKPGGKLDNRLTINGPVIVFDSPAESMRVDGAGRMLVEDYREPPKAEVPSAAPTSSPDSPTTTTQSDSTGTTTAPSQVGTSDNQVVNFTGRGATLFTWTGSLLMDAHTNTMTIDQQVQMVHRPAGSNDVMQMDARRFVAQLEETGGLSSWLNPHPPTAMLRAVLATDDVRILAAGKSIQTDRLVYTGSDKMVLLEADPGRMTQMTEANNPNTFSSRMFRWDMIRNRVTIEQPGPNRINIPDK